MPTLKYSETRVQFPAPPLCKALENLVFSKVFFIIACILRLARRNWKRGHFPLLTSRSSLGVAKFSWGDQAARFQSGSHWLVWRTHTRLTIGWTLRLFQRQHRDALGADPRSFAFSLHLTAANRPACLESLCVVEAIRVFREIADQALRRGPSSSRSASSATPSNSPTHWQTPAQPCRAQQAAPFIGRAGFPGILAIEAFGTLARDGGRRLSCITQFTRSPPENLATPLPYRQTPRPVGLAKLRRNRHHPADDKDVSFPR